jgi:hypothetical protein
MPYSQTQCSVSGCPNRGSARYSNLCKEHWISDRPLCSVEGCESSTLSRGLCNRHYRKWHYENHERDRRGHQRHEKLPIGTRRPAEGGYIRVKVREGGARAWKKEHISVMEGSLGRKLYPDESVHHRNGIRDDNQITNLELRASAHGRGQTVPDLLTWAHEIIDRYEGISGI